MATSQSRQRLVPMRSADYSEVTRVRPTAPTDATFVPKRIFFPPDPPPLGAQINVDRHRNRSGGVPRELASHVTECFYAPLSTALTDLSAHAQRRMRPQLNAYTTARDGALKELRAMLVTHAAAPPETRNQEFATFAQRQARTLLALEADAETLRATLADKASWYDLRQWKLDAGALHPRQPQHRVLEFQVVRAAAFYQEGLSPEQRRLLREAAMLMQDEVFAGYDADVPAAPPTPAPELYFFSPDLVRLLPLVDLPPELETQLNAFVEEKDALRRELVDAIITHDKARFPSSRRRAFQELARAQAARFSALDQRAEEFRRAYAPHFQPRRLARPYALPDDVAATIDRYETARARVFARIEARVEMARLRVTMANPDRSLGELHELQTGAIQSEIDAFSREYAGELAQLEAELERIYTLLVACVGEQQIIAVGAGPDAFLTEYMARYRQAWAYYEYEVAVFEPGLSPAQRRLLLGGAIRWLNLPLPRAETQPRALPLTLLQGGEQFP